jgi:hypothetical protein
VAFVERTAIDILFLPFTAMPSAVTAFSLKIASSGELAMEDVVAREVVYEWNAAHSWGERKALLPLSRSSVSLEKSPAPSDLLVAFFCAATGAPGQAAIEPEIERQLKEKRPVLIYFSEGRAHFGQATDAKVPPLEELSKRFAPEATIDSFRDEKEFRAKFALQLEALLLRHPYFRTEGEVDVPGSPSGKEACLLPETHPPAPVYSKLAQSLLMQACDDPEAYIGRVKDARGLKIQVNGRQLVDQADPGSIAEYEAAFQELLHAGLIRDAGFNGQLFQISAPGFAFLETLGKFPIGYIAELGGM